MNSITNTKQDLRQAILVEQIKLIYKPLLSVFVANSICALVVVAALWHLLPHTTLLAWITAMSFATLVRVSAYVSFRRSFSPEKVERYIIYYLFEAGLHGLLWGIAGVALFPYDDLTYQLFLIVMLIGVGAAAPITKSAFMPGFYAFFPIAVLPISFLLLSIGGPLHIGLGVSGIAFFATITHFANLSHKSLMETLRLRFENIELLEQLKQQKEEAERANLAKSHFLAAASHDLRQPLHALTLFTSVLDELVQHPEARRVVEQINTAVRSLESLFNALLDISGLDAGGIKVEQSDFCLHSLFERLKQEFTPQAHQKGLRMIWPKNQVSVHTDQSLLEQILRNYISNAIRYTDKGSISITCDSNDNYLTISVHDTGIGIPENQQDIIFEEFRQLRNPERDRNKGLGLGLAIVKRTAKLLGLDFGVQSQLGEGSTFFVTIKFADNNPQIIHPHEESISTTIGDTLILVIDDEASVREGMQSLLQIWGCQVITAANKEDAIHQLRQHALPPDGIIADYRLKDNQTGLDAIHSIQAEYGNNIPSLIITGDVGTDLMHVANDGGYQVLHKPVAPLKLRTFLRHIQNNN